MKKNNRSGFTLLELLTVMAIMVVMMSIAGASYYGMSQGAAMRGSVSNLTTTLSLARQFAVNHRNRTYVKLWKDETNSNYQVFVEIGRHVGPNGSTVLELENPKFGTEDLAGGTIFKLITGKRFEVATIGDAYTNVVNGMLVTQIEATNELTQVRRKWRTGSDSRAAWSVREKTALMNGVQFDKNVGYSGEVVFKPDGTVESKFSIDLIEVRGSAKRTVKVSSFGKIWSP